MLVNTEYMRHVIEIEDVDTTDVEEVEYAVDCIEQCAAGAVADVDVVLISAEGGVVTVEVSGHYAETGAFMRRWEDR